MKLQPFSIRGLSIDPPLVLAPMAGLTHVALRQLIAGFGGCGLFTSEMLSCRAVPHESPKHSFFLKRLPGQRPFFYQIVGNSPEAMARAIEHLESAVDDTGQGPDGFDINLGCGAPRIRNDGCGAGLMRNTDNAAKVIAACRKATSLPLTAKIRLGWEEENADELIRFARMLEDEGIDAVTLHPRLAKEKFKRRARWKYVGMLKNELRIPVIGNGDIRSSSDVLKRMNETKCDGIMIGRLAAAKPWIFRWILRAISGTENHEINFEINFKINLEELYLEFISLLEEHFPPERRIGRLKEFTHYFAENFQFGHNLASSIQNTRSMDEASQKALNFFRLHQAECSVDAVTHGNIFA